MRLLDVRHEVYLNSSPSLPSAIQSLQATPRILTSWPLLTHFPLPPLYPQRHFRIASMALFGLSGRFVNTMTSLTMNHTFRHSRSTTTMTSPGMVISGPLHTLFTITFTPGWLKIQLANSLLTSTQKSFTAVYTKTSHTTPFYMPSHTNKINLMTFLSGSINHLPFILWKNQTIASMPWLTSGSICNNDTF